MKKCLICENKIKNYRIYCSKQCASNSRIGKKHSELTKQKIRIGNSNKIFTEERKKNISESRKIILTDEKYNRLKYMWSLRCVNPTIISKEIGISLSCYKRIKKEKCQIKQLTFFPKDMSIIEIEKLIEFAKNKIYYKEIAKNLNRGYKQVYNLIFKLGYKVTTINPNRSINSSKLEEKIAEFLTKNEIVYSRQFQVENFFFDFHITNTNLLVEVHGDYWHCNPKIYKDGPKNDWQTKSIRRDFCKRDKSIKLGYKRIVLWENDIRTRFDFITTILLKEIKSATNNI